MLPMTISSAIEANTYIHSFIHAIYICMYIYIYILVMVYAHKLESMCTYAHAHTGIHGYISKCRYIHTYT